ncbi:MAG TPA: hypothetical protein VMU84_02545 [Thermoanaerobaculia bacterium]|nr:hypothetical protein [Thermoanaerobaculia bacterium]
MRRTLPFLLALLIAIPLCAQETTPPDYSRDGMLRVLHASGEPTPERNIEYEFGTINFAALGLRWRYAYLPLLAPLQGSRFNHVVTNEWPDPFVLTGTQIAQTAATWNDRRLWSAERKRAERLARRQAKVVVKAN